MAIIIWAVLVTLVVVINFIFVCCTASVVKKQGEMLEKYLTSYNKRIISICEVVDGILERRGETDERLKIKF